MNDSLAITPALENYLEAVYILEKVKKPVKVMDVARYLRVKMPSVTYNMKKLADRKLVQHKKRSHIELTDEGGRIARNVLRTHEELFKFFHDILGVSDKAAETDACRVEHILSRETVDRLVRFSQWVSSVPEAHAFRPAPHYESGAGSGVAALLSETQVGSRVRVKRINSKGGLRNRLVEMGFLKGTEVEVARVAPLGDPIEVKIKGFRLSLRKSEAAEIEVESSETNPGS